MIWSGWNEANTEKLLDLVGKGFSASEIGKQLGCTRSAAIGKAMRLGVSIGGGKASSPEAIAARSEARMRKGFGATKAKAAPAPKVRKIAPPPRTFAAVPVKPPRLTIVQPCNRPFHALERRQCRWPVSLDTDEPATMFSLFCGAATPDGQPYCDDCRPMSVTKPKTPSAAFIRGLRRYVA